MTSRASDLLDCATRPGRVRRVVTGHDDEGRSVVVDDGDAENVFRSETVAGLWSAVVWATPPDGARADVIGDPVAPDVQIAMHPAPGGTIFRIADFPPDHAYAADHDSKNMFDDIGGPDAQVTGARKHFWFHRTDSLDYAVVLDGEIWMILDDGEYLLRAGDAVVQRATGHAWSNRTDARCRMAFVLLGTPSTAATSDGGERV